MKSVIAYILLIAASTSVSLGQTLNYDSVESSYSIVESQHFIYLEVGNVWEYEVHHTENAGPVAPSFLRFTIETYRDTSPSIDDYFVRTDLYDDENKIQTALCLVRLQRGRVTIGSNVANFSVCNYQSPFSQQDFEIDRNELSPSSTCYSG